MSNRVVEGSASLAEAEELLAFHEGSAKPKQPGGHPVVWINAEDFERILTGVRAARLRKHAPVGTALMNADAHGMSHSVDWCRGWNSCLDAIEAAEEREAQS